MSEDNKSIEEIIAISYFDTDNIDIKKHIERYFEIKRNIVNVLNKYNIMWTITDTNGYNNKDKEIERLNNIINELEKSIDISLKEFEDNKDYFIDEITLKDLKNELQELKGSDK